MSQPRPQGHSRRLPGAWNDARYGLRLLARQPGFTAIAVLTTALGVGATTTLASVAYGVAARPLPYAHADRLVRVIESRPDSTRLLPAIMSNGPFHMWREGGGTIDGIAAFRAQAVMLDADGVETSRVRGLAATASLFPVLASSPLHGTYFTPAHEVEGSRNVVVLSYGLWMERFGGKPDAVGRTVKLDGIAHTIIGVAPREFAFPDGDHRYWVPFGVEPPSANRVSLFGAIARLKPGVTAEQAAAEATSRAQAGPELGMVGMAVFGSKAPPVVDAVPLVDFLAGEVRPALVLLLVAVALLFLTAVANVSSLQLARATARRRELAIRAAIGAGSGRLSRQLVIEGSILGLAGGLVGLALAVALHAVLPSILPASFPRIADIRLDAAIVAGAMVIALLAGVAFGVLPALQARRLDLLRALTEDGQAPVGVRLRSSTGFARSAIMASQVAAATLLLVCAVLLSRSFAARWAIDRGYDPTSVLTAEVAMPAYAFSPPERARVIGAILGRIAAGPDVTAAAFTSILPLSRFESLAAFKLPSTDGVSPPIEAQAAVRTVSADYQRAMGIRLAQGRWLRADDTTSSPPVVVVNRAFERAYLGEAALGARLPIGLAEDVDAWEVVGIIEDVQPKVGGEPPRPEVFVSYAQRRQGLDFDVPTLVVRSSGDPAALVPMLREVLKDAHPSIAIESVMTMEARLGEGLGEPRLYSLLVGSFAALALVIASAGLFGTLSYSVARRTRELGIRGALGATPARLLTLVLRQGLGVAVVGVAVGLSAAALGGSLLSGLVYGVSTRDPLTFSLVPLGLIVIAAVACLAPALRAARTDPLRALKQG